MPPKEDFLDIDSLRSLPVCVECSKKVIDNKGTKENPLCPECFSRLKELYIEFHEGRR